MLSYSELMGFWHRGMRNGNWYRLGIMDRIFYRAATCYAKIRSMITNIRIIALLSEIARKMKHTIKRRILKAGMDRSRKILSTFESNGVFRWAPQVKEWLNDLFYVAWLGLNSQSPLDSWNV